MRHAHRALRLVYVLSAGSRGSKPIDLQLGGEDAQRGGRFGDRRYADRSEGSVPTLVFVEGRDAHQAVHSRLEGEIGRQIVSLQLQNAAMAVAAAVVEFRNQLPFPIHLLRKGGVHVEKHASPVAGVFASGSCMKLQERT